MSIIIEGLSKSYYDSNLKEEKKILNFDNQEIIKTNDLTVIIGKNGSGKSTFLNCIAGLLPFEDGIITVDIPNSIKYTIGKGNQEFIPIEERKKIGCIFQQKLLWDHFKILDNIVNPLVNVHKLSKTQAIERAKSYLKDFFGDLTEQEREKYLYSKYPFQLSGGQQRKVAIARTFAMEPDLLLIDELEANLDQSSLKMVMDNLKKKFIDKCKTVIIVSHSIDLLEEFSPNIVVLGQNQIIAHAKGVKNLLEIIDTTPDNISYIKQTVDSSAKRWFLAKQSLDSVINISKLNIEYCESNNLFIELSKEVSKLIVKFSPESEHLLLISTRDLSKGPTIRSAEKTKKFMLNGKDISFLNGLLITTEEGIDVESGKRKEKKDFTEDKKKNELFINGGFSLKKKHETNGKNSLIDFMFNSPDKLWFQYDKRHEKVKGAYYINIETLENRPLEKESYYEFSTETKGVYLISCVVDGEVKGIISIDTTSEEKWSNFIIQQLILVGNMVAIAIKNHELNHSIRLEEKTLSAS